MSNVILHLEIVPGTEILDACREACRLAKQLNVNVRFGFNGRKLMAKPTSEPETLEAKYRKGEK